MLLEGSGLSQTVIPTYSPGGQLQVGCSPSLRGVVVTGLPRPASQLTETSACGRCWVELSSNPALDFVIPSSGPEACMEGQD